MGYSFYSPSENKVFVARNAEFFESKLLYLKASGSVEDLELIQEEDTNTSVDTSLNHEEDDQEIKEPQRDLGEPANYKAALLDTESKKWLDAMNVEMQSMKDNDVYVLVKLPPNARTIAKGFTQTYKVDYEETFSPVADIRAIKILIAIAAYYDYEIWQMDVKTAFLNGHLSEEVYMEKPKGFVNPKYPNHVCKLKRFIYGLKQASRQCNMERELRVSCYTDDARYLMDANNLKAQTGYVFILNGGVVDWKSTKQSIFATSSTDAEYIAAFDASKEAVRICKFISGLGIVSTIEKPISIYCDNTGAIAIAKDDGVSQEAVRICKFISGLGIVSTIEKPISIYCDNTGAIAIAKDDGVTNGARHFYAKVHYLRKTIKLGDIKIEKIDTDDNLADSFTKALAFSKHSELTRNIGLLPASSFM
uniref:Reverse transcriptase Ty1/copia-type domain-containing protein n=1 Tax=Tanacetum cinerariifolium TaxID=118510 RepID=A0A699HKR1_TANCI|nr:hypothetical protein [Tanacetum cinerariifolium]